MPELIPTAEVATRLGVTPGRVRQLLKRRSDFPQPAVRTPNVLLWDAGQIDAWAAHADRSVGRPAHPTTKDNA
jgi:predicted DNA-binding transcriptional regulator AlpA